MLKTNHMGKYEFSFLITVADIVTMYQIIAKYNSKQPRMYQNHFDREMNFKSNFNNNTLREAHRQ